MDGNLINTFKTSWELNKEREFGGEVVIRGISESFPDKSQFENAAFFWRESYPVDGNKYIWADWTDGKERGTGVFIVGNEDNMYKLWRKYLDEHLVFPETFKDVHDWEEFILGEFHVDGTLFKYTADFMCQYTYE